jgi:dCMP deaminase
METVQRLSKEQYFASLAEMVSQRATCSRLRVGCILVKEDRVIATGYNGSISKDDHCIEVGCLVKNNHCIRTIHAEINALLQCAKYGISTEGATAYVTHFPCLNCTKALIQAGIKEIRYLYNYRNDKFAQNLIKKAKINVIKLVDIL